MKNDVISQESYRKVLLYYLGKFYTTDQDTFTELSTKNYIARLSDNQCKAEIESLLKQICRSERGYIGQSDSIFKDINNGQNAIERVINHPSLYIDRLIDGNYFGHRDVQSEDTLELSDPLMRKEGLIRLASTFEHGMLMRAVDETDTNNLDDNQLRFGNVLMNKDRQAKDLWIQTDRQKLNALKAFTFKTAKDVRDEFKAFYNPDNPDFSRLPDALMTAMRKSGLVHHTPSATLEDENRNAKVLSTFTASYSLTLDEHGLSDMYRGQPDWNQAERWQQSQSVIQDFLNHNYKDNIFLKNIMPLTDIKTKEEDVLAGLVSLKYSVHQEKAKKIAKSLIKSRNLNKYQRLLASDAYRNPQGNQDIRNFLEIASFLGIPTDDSENSLSSIITSAQSYDPRISSNDLTVHGALEELKNLPELTGYNEVEKNRAYEFTRIALRDKNITSCTEAFLMFHALLNGRCFDVALQGVQGQPFTASLGDLATRQPITDENAAADYFVMLNDGDQGDISIAQQIAANVAGNPEHDYGNDDLNLVRDIAKEIQDSPYSNQYFSAAPNTKLLMSKVYYSLLTQGERNFMDPYKMVYMNTMDPYELAPHLFPNNPDLQRTFLKKVRIALSVIHRVALNNGLDIQNPELSGYKAAHKDPESFSRGMELLTGSKYDLSSFELSNGDLANISEEIEEYQAVFHRTSPRNWRNLKNRLYALLDNVKEIPTQGLRQDEVNKLNDFKLKLQNKINSLRQLEVDRERSELRLAAHVERQRGIYWKHKKTNVKSKFDTRNKKTKTRLQDRRDTAQSRGELFGYYYYNLLAGFHYYLSPIIYSPARKFQMGSFMRRHFDYNRSYRNSLLYLGVGLGLIAFATINMGLVTVPLGYILFLSGPGIGALYNKLSSCVSRSLSPKSQDLLNALMFTASLGGMIAFSVMALSLQPLPAVLLSMGFLSLVLSGIFMRKSKLHERATPFFQVLNSCGYSTFTFLLAAFIPVILILFSPIGIAGMGPLFLAGVAGLFSVMLGYYFLTMNQGYDQSKTKTQKNYKTLDEMKDVFEEDVVYAYQAEMLVSRNKVQEYYEKLKGEDSFLRKSQSADKTGVPIFENEQEISKEVERFNALHQNVYTVLQDTMEVLPESYIQNKFANSVRDIMNLVGLDDDERVTEENVLKRQKLMHSLGIITQLDKGLKGKSPHDFANIFKSINALGRVARVLKPQDTGYIVGDDDLNLFELLSYATRNEPTGHVDKNKVSWLSDKSRSRIKALDPQNMPSEVQGVEANLAYIHKICEHAKGDYDKGRLDKAYYALWYVGFATNVTQDNQEQSKYQFSIRDGNNDPKKARVEALGAAVRRGDYASEAVTTTAATQLLPIDAVSSSVTRLEPLEAAQANVDAFYELVHGYKVTPVTTTQSMSITQMPSLGSGVRTAMHQSIHPSAPPLEPDVEHGPHPSADPASLAIGQ